MPLSQVGPEFFERDLIPGSSSSDPEGNVTIGDGNEYGVYMSDNQAMVRAAYSRPRSGEPIAEGPVFTAPNGSPQSRVTMPAVGIEYTISTDGLDIRKPRITTALEGHYNNGFGGSEWIADSVPTDKYTISGLRLGRDLLHDELEIDLSQGLERALEVLHEEGIARVGRLAILNSAILDLPDRKKRSSIHVGRLVDEHKSQQESADTSNL